MREAREPAALQGSRTLFLRIAARRGGAFVGAGRDEFVIIIHIAYAAVPGRVGGLGRRFASVRPERPLSLLLGITTVTRPMEAIFPTKTIIIIVVAVSPAVTAWIPASITSGIGPPPAIFAAALRFGAFRVFLAAVIGKIRVPGSTGSGPGKPTIVRDGIQTVMVRGQGSHFWPPPVLWVGLEAFLAMVIRGGIPHVLVGRTAEGVGRHRTIVFCIHEMQRRIAEPLVGRLRMGMGMGVRGRIGLRMGLRMRRRRRRRRLF